MDIMEINPVEFGGAIAHIAAGQVFQILSSSETMAGAQSVDWYGGGDDDDQDVATDIMLFADYVAQTGAGGERLWRWGEIRGLIIVDVPADQEYAQLPPARRWAFDMFAAVCQQSFKQLRDAQAEETARAAIAAQALDNPPLALKDSIFEEVGSLGEIEPHQQQYLDDMATAEANAVAIAVASKEIDPFVPFPPAAASVPAVTIPAAMSIGAAAPGGETHETETAPDGEEAGETAEPETGGADEVRQVPAGSEERDVADHSAMGDAGVLPTDGETGAEAAVPLAGEAEPPVTAKKPKSSKSKK